MKLQTIAALLFGLAVFLAGCGLLTGQVQASDPATGAPLFLNADGEVTTHAADPVTGAPHQPLMEYDESGGFISKAPAVVKGLLPSPWGEGAAAILGLAASGLAIWARRKNAEAQQNRKLAVDLVQTIEAVPAAKAAVKKDAAATHSPELKAFVASVTKPQPAVK
jgi:hypothetical protein